MTRILGVALTLTALASGASAQPAPIIDVHLHSYIGQTTSSGPLWAAERAQWLPGGESAVAHMRATIAEMDRYNIVLAVVSGPEESIRAWRNVDPDRFIGGAFLGGGGMPEHSVDELQSLVDEGTVGVLGELALQYEGIAPDDSRLAPYYAWAEEAGVPVAIHTGLGPPGGPHSFAPEFRVTLGRPTLLEPIVARHPDLKMYVMHAGWPYITDTVAMMYIYPELHVDVGVLAWALPEAAFHSALRELVEAGFSDRILFGTDQMMWPSAIGLAIETIRSVPFLTGQQRRDILYNNAARFLQLSDETIAGHHLRR